MHTIYITPTAHPVLFGTVEYYNRQAEELGYRFAEMAEDYLDRIAFTPTASAVSNLMSRLATVNRQNAFTISGKTWEKAHINWIDTLSVVVFLLFSFQFGFCNWWVFISTLKRNTINWLDNHK